MEFEILYAGPLTTVQDMGRSGYGDKGWQESGCCDKYSLRRANRLAGNRADEKGQEKAVLEMTLRGPSIRFLGDVIIALAGADMCFCLNGEALPMYRPIQVKKGDVFSSGMAVFGLRGYMAFFGGIDVPVVMGSRSTNIKCRTGGLQGRALQAGDVLSAGSGNPETEPFPTGGELPAPDPNLFTPVTAWRWMGDKKIPLLRTVPGPQEEAFTGEALNAFWRNEYRLTADCDRMACRLEGEAIADRGAYDILSDGILEGSVQVTAGGKPVVMLADHQTVGGYAKIGTVIRPDIAVLAQLKPGEAVGFKPVTPQEGIEIFRREEERLARLEAYCARRIEK